MIWTVWREPRVRLAIASASAAGLFVLAAAAQYWRDEVVTPTPPLAPLTLAGAPMPTSSAIAPLGAMFGRVSSAPVVRREPTAAPPIVLLGTIAGGDRPSATCRLGATPTRILHLGDTLGGWRLQQVAPASAIFVDAAGTRHELRLSSSGN